MIYSILCDKKIAMYFLEFIGRKLCCHCKVRGLFAARLLLCLFFVPALLMGFLAGQGKALEPVNDLLDAPPEVDDAALFQVKIQVKKSLEDASAWFVSALRDDGLFIYHFDPEFNRIASYNDALRQLMASRLLAEMAAQNSELAGLHKKNLDRVLARWYQESKEGLGYFLENGESALGTNAMGLRLLCASPYYESHFGKARSIADSIVSLINEDGSFEPYFILPSRSFDRDYSLAFYSGEAVLALLEFYRKSEIATYLEAAKKAQEHYLNLYVERIEEKHYSASVPWQTQALWHLWHITKDPRYVEAIFILNDRLLTIQDKGFYPGRFFNPDPLYGGSHTSSDGVYTESLAYALDMALKMEDSQREANYRQGIALSVKNLISLQYLYEFQPAYPGRIPAKGAFKSRSNDRTVRIDNVQHIMEAYRKILSVW
ncbi:MAG: hypothetical protein QMD09_14905 [Desulfatibacillaceae bacterium]|nr:hypothetical protein [Desulfatibacillaceae bacterium]